MQETVVAINNVNFGYNEDIPILKNISMSIPRGKIIAIMGGSGSGKTTLLRLITGQCKAQSGEVIVFDKNINKITRQELLNLRKKLSMLFQFGALFTDMNVYDNVAFALKEHSDLTESMIKKIVAMKLNAVGLFGTQDMMPQELSGGMARRVALARAIALDPELMLYDEPFTGLDPISLNIAAMLIKKLSTALNQTAILVTHDIKVSLKLADYVYFMERGAIVAKGTPNEITMSNEPVVKQFISGEIDGPFRYEYPTNINYINYLEQNI